MTDAGDWIGRTTETYDVALPGPLRRLQALMDEPALEPADVPPLGHWLYFLPDAMQVMLGPDGHPRLGHELPDLGLPRRMWAGSRITFHADLPIGSELVRRTVIRSVEGKRGKSGRLAFVTLRHEIASDAELAVVEEQDLVYREAVSSPATPSCPVAEQPLPEGALVASHRFDAVELFRFSALTYNAHRIHYDRDFARALEGYPALVVHGPFQAIYLMAHLRRHLPERRVRGFDFRAVGPLFEGEEAIFGVQVAGKNAALWVRSAHGAPSITAAVEFAS